MATPTIASHAVAGPYPVHVTVDGRIEPRHRLTVFFRPLLAIPHVLLVGPASALHRTGAAGLIGAAAYLLAVVNWCWILVTGHEQSDIRTFQLFYLRWRTRVLAYVALFVDGYPPFGDAVYPATIEVGEPPASRDKVMVALRPIVLIPHLVALVFLLMAWFVVTVVAWFAILFTGRYPEGARPFALGVMRWLLRVEAYALLLVDEYPPFSLE